MAKPDTRSKALLYLVLKDIGIAQPSREIQSAPQYADMFFQPGEGVTPDRVAQPLRLLVRMATPCAIFEPFRNSPTHQQCLDIVDKSLTLNRELRPRNLTAAHQYENPRAWILTHSRPGKALKAMEGEPDASFGTKGIYRLRGGPGTYIVVLRELEHTPETLILRLLGRNKTLQGALADINTLEDTQLRTTLREFIESYAMVIERTPPQDRRSEEEEFLAEARVLLQERDEKARQEGHTQGREEGLALAALHIYTHRFGTPSDNVTTAINALSVDELLDLTVKITDRTVEQIHMFLGLES